MMKRGDRRGSHRSSAGGWICAPRAALHAHAEVETFRSIRREAPRRITLPCCDGAAALSMTRYGICLTRDTGSLSNGGATIRALRATAPAGREQNRSRLLLTASPRFLPVRDKS